jgi:hypothetical protein
MRSSEPQTLLSLALLPIFFLGAFPMLLLAFLGFAGLVILGVLMICVGLADRLDADRNYNEQVIVHGYARRSERAIDASNLRSAIRFATLMDAAGAGLIVAGLLGYFYGG